MRIDLADKLQEKTGINFRTQRALVKNELMRFANKCRKNKTVEHRRTLVLCSPHLKCYIAIIAAPPWAIPMKEFMIAFHAKVLKDDSRFKQPQYADYDLVLVAIRHRLNQTEIGAKMIPTPSNNKKD